MILETADQSSKCPTNITLGRPLVLAKVIFYFDHCVCAHVLYVRMCVHTVCVRMCACTVRTCVHMYTLRTYVCVYDILYACVYIRMYVCVYVIYCAYIHTH